MDLLLPVVLSAVAVLGAIAGVVVAVRSGGLGERARTSVGAEQGLRRVTAEVHTGWEQTLLGLTRELGLPRTPADLRYGQLYLETRTERRVFVRSRSEIGRGFLGAIDLDPRRGLTAVTYAILRLPGDDDLHEAVLGFELALIAALRRLDRDVNVQLAADALRSMGRSRAPLEEGARDRLVD